MAITLPDIVQKVVLDTKGFNVSAAKLGAGYAAVGAAANEAAHAHDGHTKEVEKGSKAADAHTSRISRMSSAVKRTAPGVLTFANNFYKARMGMDAATKAGGRHNSMLSKIGSGLKKGALGAAKFGAKWGAIGLAIMSVGIPALAGLGGGLIALVGSMGRALGIVPALAGAFGALFAVLGVGMLLFSGVGKAMKKATGGGKSAAASQKAVAGASRQVADAKRAEAEAYANIAEVAYEAQRRVQDASYAVVKAENALVESKGRVRQAQVQLNGSFEKAARHIEDTRRASLRAAISEERATMSLRDARQALLDAMSSGDVNAMADARLDLQSAELDLADATDANTDAAKELERVEANGIDRSDIVLEARNELAEARYEEAEAAYELRQAELDLYDAQREGLKSVAEARQAAADATQAVADAQADLADAASPDSGGGGSNDEPVNAPTKALVAALEAAKKRVKPLKEDAQAIAFPGVITGLGIGLDLMDRFRGQILGTAKLIGQAFVKIPMAFARVGDEAGNIFNSSLRFGSTALDLMASLISGATRFVSAGSFVTDYFSTLNTAMAEWIDKTTTAAGFQERMQRFFLKALASAITWGHIVRDFFWGLIDIFKAGADEGDSLSKKLEGVAASFRAWTGDEKNQDKMRSFFEDAGRITSSIFRILGRILGALGSFGKDKSLDAFAQALENIEKSPAFEGFLTTLSDFGQNFLPGLISGLGSLWDVITGDKEASTDTEKMVSSMMELSELTDGLGVFADVLSTVVDGIRWMSDNVPGFDLMVKAVAGMAAISFLGKKSGITAMISAITNFAQSRNVRMNLGSIKRTNEGIATSMQAPVKQTIWEKFKNKMRGTGEAAQAEMDQVEAAVDGVDPCIDPCNKDIVSQSSLDSVDQVGTRVEQAEGKVGTSTGKMRGKFRTLGRSALNASGKIAGIGFAAAGVGTLVGGEAGDKITQYGSLIGGAAGLFDVFTLSTEGATSAIKTSTLANAAAKAKTVAMNVATKAAAAGQWLLNAAMSANPVMLVVLAIAALAAGLYLLYKKNEGFRKFIDNLWQSIQKMWDKVLPILKGIWDWVATKLVAGFKLWASIAIPYFKALGAIALWLWDTVLKPVFMAIWWYITEVLIPGWTRIFEVAKTVFGAIATVATWFWNTILKPVFTAIWWYITTVLIPGWTRIFQVAKTVFGAIATAAIWFWNTILKPIFTAVWGFIRDNLIPKFLDFKDKATKVFQAVWEKVTEAWGIIKPKFQAIKDFVSNTLIPAFQDVRDKVAEVFGALGGIISGAFEGVKSAVNTGLRFIGGAVATVLGAMATIANGVGLKDSLGKNLTSWADSARGWGRETSGQSSPPRNGRYDGQSDFMAAGGHVPFANARRTEVGAGFKTGTPRAIVGEGSRHPEYVIPTDPKYRTRAFDLAGSLLADLTGPGRRNRMPDGHAAGTRMLAEGGIMDWGQKIRERGVDFLAERVPSIPLKGDFFDLFRGAANKVRDKVFELLKGGADKQLRDLDIGGRGTGAGGARNINPAFLAKFQRYAAKYGLSIGSGWRSPERQAQLYADYLAGRGNLAARPGTSNHEKGLAIDHRPATSTTAMRRDAYNNFGLYYPMASMQGNYSPTGSQYEPWHIEPKYLNDPARMASGGMTPALANGGIITDETWARMGEFGRPEAVIPLDSFRGRNMLGGGGVTIEQVNVDLRGTDVNDPEAIKRAVRDAMEEVMDEVSTLVEMGLS